MDLEDKFIFKVSGVQSFSSSVQSTPEKNRHSDNASRCPEPLQEFLKSCPKKELFRTSKCKMAEQIPKTSKKTLKNNKDHQPPRKQPRKGENPVRIPPAMENCSDSSICKNSACRAVLSVDDTFCKRCSCCICHLFDENKDPSLWLECASESGHGDFCGLSCHVECAVQHGKVGVVNHGQLMQLDGSYCCASCGKVSGILGYWRKQLTIAKDARRVDVLCSRILLSYRLLNETSRFKQLHDIIKDAKFKLETELGPLNGVSTKMARGIVSRLTVASEVQTLCSLGIEKVDELLSSTANMHPISVPATAAACKFLFEEVTSTSVEILLIELSNDIKGYKLWVCRARDETHSKEPVLIFPRSQRRIFIPKLRPCTEYSFRVASYNESGDIGHSEANCFTLSLEIVHKNPDPCPNNPRKPNSQIESDSGFKVRDLGKILHLARARKICCCFSGDVKHETCNVKPETCTETRSPAVPLGLDLNIASVPDLNEEVTLPFESQNWNNGLLGEVSTVDSQPKKPETSREERPECDDSTLINGSSPLIKVTDNGCLDESFEYCVKIIRWLECEGHIEREFRLKLLTWFSLRSNEQERRVVNTFIQTLIDDPSSLGGQLVDSFSDIVSRKRPRNGFCGKLWH